MSAAEDQNSVPNQDHYRNPVYNSSFPDPFVLKHRGEYWGYCSGTWHDGRRLGIARSPDLVHWDTMPGALEPLPGNHSEYWAPEVAFDGRTFYLYYSVGNETQMQIRVATSTSPAGPFRDCGRRLTAEEFAIDPHVFVDDDGAWYLFYATDYLTHSHIGTGTAMDRFVDPMTLAGNPKPVVRAAYDWQVYDPARKAKGGVRWHTVEGPFVLRRKGRYYEMFSGGNWQNPSYGVAYAVADRIDQPAEWDQIVDGRVQLPILRTIPGKVVGPGHNSVVRGPDNVQNYCVYHRWVDDARVMAIDRLEWVGERLVVLGATTDEEPAPNRASATDFTSQFWRADAEAWTIESREASLPAASGTGGIAFDLPSPTGILEFSYRDDVDDRSEAGLHCRLIGEAGPLGSVDLSRMQPSAIGGVHGSARRAGETLFRLEVDSSLVRLRVDGLPTRVISVRAPLQSLLFSCKAGTHLLAPAFTAGWIDEFADDRQGEGWAVSGTGRAQVSGQAMSLEADADGRVSAAKGPPFERYEAVINLRPLLPSMPAARFGVAIGEREDAPGCVFRQDGSGWLATVGGRDTTLQGVWQDADDAEFRQLRVRCERDRAVVLVEGQVLGEFPREPGVTRPVLFAEDMSVAFDLVRVTALSH